VPTPATGVTCASVPSRCSGLEAPIPPRFGSANQIELVDITPEALRRRLAHGNVYAAEKIDAALVNDLRTGNLAARRELALLWVAELLGTHRMSASHRMSAPPSHISSHNPLGTPAHSSARARRTSLLSGMVGTIRDRLDVRKRSAKPCTGVRFPSPAHSPSPPPGRASSSCHPAALAAHAGSHQRRHRANGAGRYLIARSSP
jgi:Osmosensitive K+ channel His kinase sensor domain